MDKPPTKTLKLVRVLQHLEARQYPWIRIECARSGCHDCHSLVMESFKIETELLATLEKYEPSQTFEDLCDYVAYRQAHPMKTGRHPQTDADMIRDLEIGRYAEILKRQGNKLPDVLEKTAKKFLVSESTVRDARKQFLDAVKLINEAAEQINGE
jgi:hypothetical protein